MKNKDMSLKNVYFINEIDDILKLKIKSFYKCIIIENLIKDWRKY